MLFPYLRSCALRRDKTANKGETYEEAHIVFLARPCRRQHHCCSNRNPRVISGAYRPSLADVSARVSGSEIVEKYTQVPAGWQLSLPGFVELGLQQFLARLKDAHPHYKTKRQRGSQVVVYERGHRPTHVYREYGYRVNSEIRRQHSLVPENTTPGSVADGY